VALHSLDDIIIKSHKKPFKNPRKPKTASSNSNSTIFELDLSRVIELDSSLSQSETRIPILIECLLKSSDRMIETSGIFRKSSAVCTITGMDLISLKSYASEKYIKGRFGIHRNKEWLAKEGVSWANHVGESGNYLYLFETRTSLLLVPHVSYSKLIQKNESRKDLKSRIINVYENNDASKCLKSRVLSVLEEEKFNTPNIHAAMLKNFLQNLPEPLLIPGYKKIFNIITGKSQR